MLMYQSTTYGISIVSNVPIVKPSARTIYGKIALNSFCFLICLHILHSYYTDF